jgi:predicted nucleic-acid-binding protein
VKSSQINLPDTNYILRYLLKDNETLYKKAHDFFDKVKSGGMKAIILESIIAECIYVLTGIYEVPRSEAAAKLIGILQYKGIANADKQELIKALTLFSAHNFDIVDCIVCAKSKNYDMPMFTFDEKLNKACK